MLKTRPIGAWVTALAAMFVVLIATPLPAQDGAVITVRFDRVVSHEPVSGSVYLLISRRLVGEPRQALRDGPFDGIVLRRDVARLAPGEPLVFDARVPGHPQGLDGLEPGRYAVQALLDLSRTSAEITEADGNGKSGTVRLELAPGRRHEVVIDDLLQQPRREDVGRIRYRYLESRIVGRQTGSRFFMQTAVVMPLNFRREEGRRYPVQYWIPGIGEDVRSAVKYFQERGLYFPPYGGSFAHCEDFILVLLDPNGRRGFHGFMDSAGHGAFRQTLFSEIIPAIEAEFPVVTASSGRFLVGSGAGGLAALRLQAEHPDFFAGAWALAPDPVSNADFFGLDLGADPLPSAYVDAEGRERVLARRDGRAVLTMREQAAFEEIVRGGFLIQSYEAMYAPLDDDLRPRPLFDRGTGRIDPESARAFSRHDFLANLEANWDAHRDDYRGRFHVLVGDKDDFYLHRGVTRLKSFLDGVGDGDGIAILPGLDHAAMKSEAVQLRVQAEIVAAWRALEAAR